MIFLSIECNYPIRSFLGCRVLFGRCARYSEGKLAEILASKNAAYSETALSSDSQVNLKREKSGLGQSEAGRKALEIAKLKSCSWLRLHVYNISLTIQVLPGPLDCYAKDRKQKKARNLPGSSCLLHAHLNESSSCHTPLTVENRYQ